MYHADYITAVFRSYELKKENGLISLRLANPSTAKLKNECIVACSERFSIKDQGILKEFFGPIGDDVMSCIKVIKRFDRDRFRPLVNYLRRKTKETDPKNIELLAWLIDYEPRPWGYKSTNTDIKQKRANGGILTGENITVDAIPGGSHHDKKAESASYLNFLGLSLPMGRQRIIGIIAILIVMAAVTAVYSLSTGKPDRKTDVTSQRCMYWADDHYEPIDCNQKVNNALVIALDSHRLKHFRKITDIKTISRNSIGKVWYIKMNNNIEFYTSSGFHPVEVRRTLRPVSRWIIDKYVLQIPD